MSETNLVAASLEALAENDADPTAAVYQRFFA
jgi:hypothetical protein